MQETKVRKGTKPAHKPQAKKSRTSDFKRKVKSHKAGNLKNRNKALGSSGNTPVPILARRGRYFATRDGLFVVKETKDDTVNVSVRIPAADFSAMNWVLPKLGSSFVLQAGSMTKDHTRAAIQLLSGQVPRTTVFTHTGSRKRSGVWVYIHGGGAIGADGPVAGIEVKLTSALAPFNLRVPETDREIVDAVRASLDLIDVGPADVMVPTSGSAISLSSGAGGFCGSRCGTDGLI
jgi:hypothetical protein